MSSSSSAAKGTSSRREINPFPSKVAVIDSETAFDTIETKPGWRIPEFGKRTDLVKFAATCKGCFVPAGTTFTLGASIPCMTVLQYGMYVPAGTMLPQGALIPIHQRLVSIVPLETKFKFEAQPENVWCTIQ